MTTTTKRKPASKKTAKKSAKRTATKKKTTKKKAAKKTTKKSSSAKSAAKKKSTKKAPARSSTAKKGSTKKKVSAAKAPEVDAVDHQPSLLLESLDAAWPSTMAELSAENTDATEPFTIVALPTVDPDHAVVVARPTNSGPPPGILTRICHRVLEWFGGRWPER